jgi:SAM-dependent methyltransferase
MHRRRLDHHLMSELPDSLRASYDAVAAAYVEHLFSELAQKPLDRHLLNRFAEEVRERGIVGDLGCGPGHVARYLHEQGVRMLGVDLSPEMVQWATRLNPGIEFRVGDIRDLELADESLAGIVAFYSVIHLDPSELATALREFRRVLMRESLLLLSFHIGDETLHLDELWEKAVSLDFHFLQPAAVIAALQSAGFLIRETVEREPYDGAEYPSRRCYLLARAA